MHLTNCYPSFSVSDGLVKLEELVATRFKLIPGCFRLKYADADGVMILIACDSDLMGSASDSRHPGHQTLIRLLTMWISKQLAGNVSECHALALSIHVTLISKSIVFTSILINNNIISY